MAAIVEALVAKVEIEVKDVSNAEKKVTLPDNALIQIKATTNAITIEAVQEETTGMITETGKNQTMKEQTLPKRGLRETEADRIQAHLPKKDKAPALQSKEEEAQAAAAVLPTAK